MAATKEMTPTDDERRAREFSKDFSSYIQQRESAFVAGIRSERERMVRWCEENAYRIGDSEAITIDALKREFKL